MLYLQFQLGNDRYAIEATRVVEIVPLVAVKKNPRTPDSVAGLMIYRGRPVTTLDLSQLLLGRPAAERHSTRIIIIRRAGSSGASPHPRGASPLAPLTSEPAAKLAGGDQAEKPKSQKGEVSGSAEPVGRASSRAEENLAQRMEGGLSGDSPHPKTEPQNPESGPWNAEQYLGIIAERATATLRRRPEEFEAAPGLPGLPGPGQTGAVLVDEQGVIQLLRVEQLEVVGESESGTAQLPACPSPPDCETP